MAWLRQILINNLRDAARRFRVTGSRRIARERSFSPGVELRLRSRAAPAMDTPSRLTRKLEEHFRLEQALARLSEEHRRVIELRNLELLSFVEIGPLINRSPDATRKLWGRAIAALEQQLGEFDVP